ncbi:MAG: Flp family type IVb pilin [bacterium]|nr:Flp family type IVb pilin [bacterium]
MIEFPTKIGKFLVAFAGDESGATAIEYGLIASGIFLAIFVAVNSMATSINTMYSFIASNVKAAI